MRGDLEKRLLWCLPCAARTTAGKKRTAALQPFKVGVRFNTVAADILGPVTTATQSRAKYILAMTDLFTKFVVTVPLVRTESADVALAIVNNWILRFGVPDVLHTDQGRNFGSELTKEVCKLLKIDKTRTSPYHPQGNGQVERHNRVIADLLSKYCAQNPRTWDTMLPYMDFVYNSSVHKTTQATPFCLVYGQECQYPIDLFYPRPHDQERSQDEFVEWLDGQFREAHMNARELLGCNQRRQKDQYHKKVYGKPYEPHDKVWVFDKRTKLSKKFFLPWEGPYVVLERTSEVNYKVAKPNQLAKFRILHFNMLKPFVEEEPDVGPRRPSPLRGNQQYENDDDPDQEEGWGDAQGIVTEGPLNRTIQPSGTDFKGVPLSRIPAPNWLDQSLNGQTLETLFQEETDPADDGTQEAPTAVAMGGPAATPADIDATPNEVTDLGTSRYESATDLQSEQTVVSTGDNGAPSRGDVTLGSPMPVPTADGLHTSTPQPRMERPTRIPTPVYEDASANRRPVRERRPIARLGINDAASDYFK